MFKQHLFERKGRRPGSSKLYFKEKPPSRIICFSLIINVCSHFYKRHFLTFTHAASVSCQLSSRRCGAPIVFLKASKTICRHRGHFRQQLFISFVFVAFLKNFFFLPRVDSHACSFISDALSHTHNSYAWELPSTTTVVPLSAAEQLHASNFRVYVPCSKGTPTVGA